MASAQTSIESLVGPPVTLIPFLGYPDGTYNPETTSAGKFADASTASQLGTIADFSAYRGVIMQVMGGAYPGTNANSVSVIPHHGSTSAFSSHAPFGTGWGFYENGKGHGTPGTSSLKNIYIDMDLSNPFLSCEVVVNISTPDLGLVGVKVIPVLPKISTKLDDYPAAELLRVFQSGDLNLVS